MKFSPALSVGPVANRITTPFFSVRPKIRST
jgi:hypothetical protein